MVDARDLAEAHVAEFVKLEHAPQKAIGLPPAAWLRTVLGNRIDDSRLPSSLKQRNFRAALAAYEYGERQLNRQEVADLCRSSVVPALLGYVCAMAWGGQMPKSARKAIQAWQLIQKHCDRIREGSLSRSQAFDLFARPSVDGLGPAYFTKLLYFFSPARHYCYIMDQWIAKSMILLTGNRALVIMDGDWVSRRNTGEHYEKFCAAVESLAVRAKACRPDINITKDNVEEYLFSQGGRENKIGEWRRYVKKNYK